MSMDNLLSPPGIGGITAAPASIHSAMLASPSRQSAKHARRDRRSRRTALSATPARSAGHRRKKGPRPFRVCILLLPASPFSEYKSTAQSLYGGNFGLFASADRQSSPSAARFTVRYIPGDKIPLKNRHPAPHRRRIRIPGQRSYPHRSPHSPQPRA